MHLSHFCGLILVLHRYEYLTPVLMTGESRTISKLYSRYLSTGIHIKSWFTSDPFDPALSAYRSVKAIRGFHSQYAHKVSKCAGVDPNLKLSQNLLSRAIFSFFAFITVFPKEVRI